MVSNAREDLPLPLSPVITTNSLRGKLTSIFLRLCTRAPNTSISRCSPKSIGLCCWIELMLCCSEICKLQRYGLFLFFFLNKKEPKSQDWQGSATFTCLFLNRKELTA